MAVCCLLVTYVNPRVGRPNLTGTAKTQTRRVDHTRRGAAGKTSRQNDLKVPVLRSQLYQHDNVVLRADNCKLYYQFKFYKMGVPNRLVI
jgi:hypothetical protein